MGGEGRTRRRFYDVHVPAKSPLAEKAPRPIAYLYAIEADIAARPPMSAAPSGTQPSLVEAMQGVGAAVTFDPAPLPNR
jgi:hypothetical protein